MTSQETYKLSMEPKIYSHSGPVLSGPVMLYEVGGMPKGQLVQILNLRAQEREPSWQIRRVATDETTGNFLTAEDALAALQSQVNS
jgi:hypothetical protein